MCTVFIAVMISTVDMKKLMILQTASKCMQTIVRNTRPIQPSQLLP